MLRGGEEKCEEKSQAKLYRKYAAELSVYGWEITLLMH